MCYLRAICWRLELLIGWLLYSLLVDRSICSFAVGDTGALQLAEHLSTQTGLVNNAVLERSTVFCSADPLGAAAPARLPVASAQAF